MFTILLSNKFSGMKMKLFLLLLPLSLLLFQSCEPDEDDGYAKKSFIEYSLVCDNPDALVEVKSTGLGYIGTRFNGGVFNKKCYTEDNLVYIDAICDDENATMSIILSVNGKEVLKQDGKDHLLVVHRIKGTEKQ